MVDNIGMILLIKTDSRLQTPMYFFLQHLAFVDICYTSAITPKMLQNFTVGSKLISFKGCVMQLLIYATFATSDCYLLATMAVDRYVAVCNPLHYPIVMSWRVCIPLVAGSYIMGFINASGHTGFTFSLVFCKGNTINHFFCDVPPILALSCSNIDINIMLITVFVGFNIYQVGYHLFLWKYHYYHPKDVFYYREEKSLLHLCLPPGCSHHFLWNSLLHVLTTSF